MKTVTGRNLAIFVDQYTPEVMGLAKSCSVWLELRTLLRTLVTEHYEMLLGVRLSPTL